MGRGWGGWQGTRGRGGRARAGTPLPLRGRGLGAEGRPTPGRAPGETERAGRPGFAPESKRGGDAAVLFLFCAQIQMTR